MKIPAVKGTRDLYPEDYAPIQRIFDVWRNTSLVHGFEEFEGPTLEYLDLYREKSGDELVGQLYRLTDSGGRELALRPEMTPTLARMVAARIATLPKPLKWFCIPRLFRGENVQRGRLREFYQWNVDIIGSADVIADAECILVGIEALTQLGLSESDFIVYISNRRLIAAILDAVGIETAEHGRAYALMDKAGKIDDAEMARRWDEAFGSTFRHADLTDLLSATDLDALRETAAPLLEKSEALRDAVAETDRLFTAIADFGILEFCELNLKIIRGLAYYTGPVFEFFDRSGKERAICGGGRYDDLLGKLGKTREPAVGFGMGDVVLALILAEKGLLKAGDASQTVYVADAAEGLRSMVLRVVAALRRGGLRAEFGYAWQPVGRQLKAADRKNARFAVLLGDETRQRDLVQVKDLRTGESREVELDELLARPAKVLSPT